MSWNQFDEFKGFARGAKRKRSYGLKRPLSRKSGTSSQKKQKLCTKTNVEEDVGTTEEDIGGFSSSDEEGEKAQTQYMGLKVRRKFKRRCLQREEGFSSPTGNPHASPSYAIKNSDSVSPEISLKDREKTGYEQTTKFEDVGETTDQILRSDIAWSASETSDEENHHIEEKKDKKSKKHSIKSLNLLTEVRRTSPMLTSLINEFGSSSGEEQANLMPDEVDISPPTPTQGSDEQNPITCRTASEWIKHVEHSEEGRSVEKSDPLLDSAKKKKKKWKRSGLAEQLQRLITREKSDRAFWAHRHGDSQYSDGLESSADTPGSSVLTVQILSQLQQYSHLFTRCHVVSSDPQEPAIVDIAFAAETSKQLGLSVGSCIKIFPPWQTLEVPSLRYPVLLCTYYCEKVSTPTSSPPVDLLCIEDIACHQLVTGRSATDSRPHLLQSPRKGFQPTKLLFDERGKCFGSSELGDKTKDKLSFMKRTEESPCKESEQTLMQPLSLGETVNTNLSALTISNAIDLQGDCSGERISFCGLIQRVYRKVVKRPSMDQNERNVFLSKSLVFEAFVLGKEKEARWHLLVEDPDGMFCEILVPPEDTTQHYWNLCIEKGEGKRFNFTNLRVLRRTNRTRSPGLFSIITSMCPQTDLPTSQTTSSSQEEETADQNPGPFQFCYILTVEAESSVTEIKSPCSRNETPALHRAPKLRQLDTVSNFAETISCRLSFYGILLFARSSSTKAVQQSGCIRGKWDLIVTDKSLQKAQQNLQDRLKTKGNEAYSCYVKVDVLASHVMDNSDARVLGKRGVRLFLKDILYSVENKGILIADAYSVIKEVNEKIFATRPSMEKVNVAELFNLTKVPFPDLTLDSREGMLYRVEGTVADVDEDAAFCWLECDNCGDPNITKDMDDGSAQGSTYNCVQCGCKVRNPRTRVHLEIFLRCITCPDTVTKVKLQQRTVELLMPVSYQDSQEGYDMDSVLNKNVGPITCLLVQLSSLLGETKTPSYQLYLEEIPASL